MSLSKIVSFHTFYVHTLKNSFSNMTLKCFSLQRDKTVLEKLRMITYHLMLITIYHILPMRYV